MKRALVAAVVAIGTTIVLSGAPAFAIEPDRIVVMISVDGLAGYYLDDPKAEMPAIRALVAAGRGPNR